MHNAPGLVGRAARPPSSARPTVRLPGKRRAGDTGQSGVMLEGAVAVKRPMPGRLSIRRAATTCSKLMPQCLPQEQQREDPDVGSNRVAFGQASGLKIVTALVVPEECRVVALVRTGQV